MTLGPRSSKEVFTILPLNSWTEVILISSTSSNNDVYIVTTEDKLNKRLEDMNVISNLSCNLDNVKDFKEAELVAIEIDGKWYRGKLLSFNELQSDDTRIELIDIGSVHQTKLQNLFILPYYLKYEPLVLPIKFKNFIPKTKKFTIKPLLTENTLHEGFVLVDVNGRNELDFIQNGKHQVDSKKICLPVNGSNIGSVKNMTNGSTNDLLSPNSLNDSNITVIQNKTNGHHTDVLSSYLSNSKRKNNLRSLPKLYDMPLKNEDYCLITYFEDITCVYVCKAIKKDMKYEMYNFDILTKTADESEDKILKDNPIVGEFVRVFSQQDHALFRAKILKNNNDGSFNVFYIDYGNKETVLCDAIFELADELKKQPGLAVKVGMIHNFKHMKQYTEEIKTMFSCFANDEKPFVVEIDETCNNCLENVKLKDIETESYIDTSYIIKYLQINSECKDIIQMKENTTWKNDCNINQLNTLKNKDIVFLKHFEDMASIYIIKNVQLFNEVMLVLNSIQCSHIPTKDFNVGNIIKVVTDLVYRAKIIKVDGNLISVMSIDFGFFEVVQSGTICDLSDDLKKVPGLAIKVGIKEPLIKKSEEIANFISNVEKIPLCLEFDEDNPNGYKEIILRREDNSKNIFDEFLKTIKHSLSCNEVLDNREIKKIMPKECLTNDYQSIKLEIGDYCIVSYFNDFKNIYVCKAVKNCTDDDSYEMHNMAIILKTMESEDRKTKTNSIIGDIVKVFSPSYQSFYRAKIMNIIDNTDFHVFYIDFGNTEIVHLSDIFELSDILKKETKLPLRVSIKVPPNSKKTDEIEIFFNNLIENNIVLSIEYSEKSISGLQNVLLRILKSGNTVNDEVLKLLPVEKMRIKNFDTCILTYFENVNHLYVSNAQDLKNIKMYIKNMGDTKIKTNSVIGDIVLVFSHSFQSFYRGKIINIFDNTDFHVSYIDFGNSEVVKFSNIFELPDNLKNKPGVAIKIGLNVKCTLKRIDEVIDMFFNLAFEEELLSIEFDESNEVGLENCILKVISNGLNINYEVSKLLSNQYPMPLDKFDDIQLKAEEFIKSSNVTKNKIESVPLKNGEIVYLRYFDDSSSVFVGRGSKEHQDQFEYVLDKTAVDTSRTKKLNIKIGDIVKTVFGEVMFRAKIIEKIDQNFCLILFIDFGNEEIVHINDIYELSDELKEISSLCVKVGLKGSPKIKKSDIVSYYTDSLETIPLYIEYDENNPNGLREVNLKIKETNCNIFDEMLKIIDKSSNIKEGESIHKSVIENENVLNISSKSKTIEIISSIDFKNGDIVFCTHFEDFNHVYLCKSSKNGTPENNCVIIDSSKVTDIVKKKNPKYGDKVRVKFDEQIFRAEVIGKSKENYCVLLVDIGKKIDVCINNIFESSNDLKNIPSLAIKVGLKGTIGFEVTDVVKDYFHHLWYSVPVPLILVYDENNLNYLNDVSLKKQRNGSDIIEDLLKICNSLNSVHDNINPIVQNPKIVGLTGQRSIVSGDHVEFLHGNSVDNIYIRQVKVYEEFKSVLNQLKVEKSENLKLVIPKINDIVIVHSFKYNGFCRGKTIDIIDNIAKCILVDFGIIEIISFKNIYELPKSFCLTEVSRRDKIIEIPKMVHRVSLAGLNKIVNNKISSYLSTLSGKMFVIEIEKNVHYWYKQVVLKDLKSGMLINEEIQKLCSTNLPMSQQRRLERKIIMPQKKNSELEKPCHPMKSGSSVFITHFESFNSIFVRDASYEFIENFNTLNKQLLMNYRNVSSTNELFKIGDKVCVRSFLNNVMFSRAIIVNNIGNEYLVFYLDYGNEEFVSSDDIFKLSDELGKYQQFAIKVQIQNMPPLTKENKSKIEEYFKKKFIVTNTTLCIEFDEFNCKGLDDVILKTEFYNVNIVDEIQELYALHD